MQYLAVFTGIVEGTGKVKKIGKTKTRSAVGMSIDLGVHSKGLKTGQSVALDGVCLTVIKRVGNTCSFEMIDETAKNTSLGLLKTGDLLNIERSVKAGSRMEGHFVLGHVDGTGIIRDIVKEPGQVRVRFDIPKPLAKFVVDMVCGMRYTDAFVPFSSDTVRLMPSTAMDPFLTTNLASGFGISKRTRTCPGSLTMSLMMPVPSTCPRTK